MISAVACSSRSEILAIWRMRRLVRLLEARLQRGDFLAEPGDRLLHRLVLFDGGDVGRAGAENVRRSPARRPRRRARPRTSPKRQAGHSVCGAAARQSGAALRAPRSIAAGSTAGAATAGSLDRRRNSNGSLAAFRWPAISKAIRPSATRSWPVLPRARHRTAAASPP